MLESWLTVNWLTEHVIFNIYSYVTVSQWGYEKEENHKGTNVQFIRNTQLQAILQGSFKRWGLIPNELNLTERSFIKY